MTPSTPGQEPSRMPTLLAIGACLAMALLNWHFLTMEIDISPASSSAALNAIALDPIEGLADEPRQTEPAAFSETLARPLFRANRRPPEMETSNRASPAPVTALKKAPKLPDDLELVGIMKESGRAGRALIRSGGLPSGQWVEVGHVVDGWRLIQIDAGSILFEADGEKKRLALFPDNTGSH